jgi:hypothetical protein
MRVVPATTPIINKSSTLVEPTLVNPSADFIAFRKVANYEYKNTGASTFDFLKQLLGIPPTQGDIAVFIEGRQVALIPPNSPIAGMTIHEQCLQFQYGTQRWYKCEEQFQ